MRTPVRCPPARSATFKMIKGPNESVYNEELQKHLFQATKLKAFREHGEKHG